MRWIALLPLLALVGFGFGCSQLQRSSADPLGAAPTDFALELTILTGPLVTTSDQAHLRQSRYVLFADGSLYQGDDVDRSHRADWLPPLTRFLSRRQVAEVWSLAQQLGFTSPKSSPSAVNFKLAVPPADGVTYLATFTGWGERWSLVRSGAAGEADPAMAQLTRELARLAWSSDVLPAAAAVMPVRYDFGPDPYARFRQPGGAPAANVKTPGGAGGGQ
jgi:hypothetical protein